MRGIPAVNINTWSGYRPENYEVRENQIIPDPGTGSLYNSQTPMQDIQFSWPDLLAAPHCPYVLPTQGNVFGG